MSNSDPDAWFAAVNSGNVQKVTELIDAHSGSVTRLGETALMTAARSGNIDLVKILANNEAGHLSPSGYTALSIAAAANNASVCEALVSFKTEHKLPRGSNPLIIAAKHGALASLKVLMKHIDISSTDADGLTALDHAVQRNFSKCALALLSANRLTIGDIEKSLLYTSAGEYSETVRVITNALRLKYSKRQRDDELVEISSKFVDQAALITRLQAENASLKAAVDWVNGLQSDKSPDTPANADALHLNNTIIELKRCVLKQSNRIHDLEAKIARAHEELIVISPGLDDYEVDMSAIRLREAEMRRLKASLSKLAEGPVELKSSSFLNNLNDCYIDEFNVHLKNDCHLNDIDDSISDISIHGPQPNSNSAAHVLIDDPKSIESNSIIEFLDGVRERAAKGKNSQRNPDSPLRFSSHRDSDAFYTRSNQNEAYSEEPGHTTTAQARLADESDIGILQHEVVELRSILEKYETDRLAKSFMHDAQPTSFFSSSMLGDFRSSQVIESLRRTISPKISNGRSKSSQPMSDPKERRVSISVLSGVNYDPTATESVINYALDNMDAGSLTDSLTREHTSVSASALKSKIEHLKERMQQIKKPPRTITTINETPEMMAEGNEMVGKTTTEGTSSTVSLFRAATHPPANQPESSILEDAMALDRYKQAYYEKTLTNMETYLTVVELKMKSLVKQAKRVFGQSEAAASDGDSITSSYDVESVTTPLADGNIEGDVMHHIEKLHCLMKHAEDRPLPAALNSNSQSKSSDHSAAGDAHDTHDNIERIKPQTHTNRLSGQKHINETLEVTVAPLPRVPSTQVLKPTEDSHSEETSDGIVPSFEAFSDTHSLVASQYSDHSSLAHQNEVLMNDLKNKASLIDKLSEELAEREAFIVQLSNKDNAICSKLEEKIKALTEELQEQIGKNKKLEKEVAENNNIDASMIRLECKKLAYEYMTHLLVSDPSTSFKATTAFNSTEITDASPLIDELTRILDKEKPLEKSNCSAALQASLEPLFNLIPSVVDRYVQDTHFVGEIVSQELENDATASSPLPVIEVIELVEATSNESLPTDSHPVTESLIKQTNADYFNINHDNNTPLMNAVLAENITAVRGLLHYARQINNKGETALMLAIPTHNEEIIRTLIGLEAGHICSDGDSALLRCLRLGEFEFAELLTDDEGVKLTGASTQHVDDENKPPEILNAASDGDIVKVWSLLRYQKRMTDATGRTSLMLAADTGNLPLVKLLCIHECKMRDSFGRTALMIAAANNQVDAALCLIPSEAGMQSNDGKTALMYAAAHNSLDCLIALIPHESGKTALKEDGSGIGYTALMVAANKAHVDAIHLLLPYEGDLRDRKGRSAADYAKADAAKEVFLQKGL